jgi:hypothetical protein
MATQPAPAGRTPLKPPALPSDAGADLFRAPPDAGDHAEPLTVPQPADPATAAWLRYPFSPPSEPPGRHLGSRSDSPRARGRAGRARGTVRAAHL